MKRTAILMMAALLVLMGFKRGNNTGYDVYLLIGQSNMAGRGTLLESDFNEKIDGVFLLDSLDVPVAASHPFNQYSTIRKSLPQQQMGPGYAFSKKVHSKTHRPVLLVVNARGGTGLDSWMPGTRYFDEAVRRARKAMKYGTLKAIIWHQGCTDGDKGRVGDYASRLEVMMSALRDSLSNVPVVVGEVAHWNPYADSLNAQIHMAAQSIPDADCVSSEGCGMLRNETDPHFSRDGQLLLGSRYADAVLGLLKGRNRK